MVFEWRPGIKKIAVAKNSPEEWKSRFELAKKKI